ncbi:hypothetical protein JX265_006208 [Neoarthrinium moseri]|uniref:Uncharacterized protein n=1 Tax=Neoarthrinium moseri TaxID=1658444 RepID=A0A9Q0AP67_9PEZI|nr:hypothetical protein JX265_006208 [Neoarthrinium moseri]
MGSVKEQRNSSRVQHWPCSSREPQNRGIRTAQRSLYAALVNPRSFSAQALRDRQQRRCDSRCQDVDGPDQEPQHERNPGEIWI